MRTTDPEKRIELAKWLWGWNPHPTQRQWLLADAKVKAAACGRRWGKTESAAVDAATMAITCPGSAQMIVAPTADQSRLIFDTVERLIMGSDLTRAISKVTRTPYPRLTVGRSLVMARTADEDGRNLRGHAADRVIVDEAAYVRDCVIQEVIAPMLADKDGRLVMVSTPFGKNHFYRSYLKGLESTQAAPSPGGEGRGEGALSLRSNPALHHVSFSFPSCSNPHISGGYIERQRHEVSARQFAVEYEAQFLDDVSAVFPWEDINAAVERHPTPSPGGEGWGEGARYRNRTHAPDELIVAGIDWARYSDYTAVIVLGASELGLRVIAIDRFNGMGWSAQIERVARCLVAHGVNAALTDQTSIGDPLLEQLDSRLWQMPADVSVDGYNFTAQSKRDLIEHLAVQFSHGRIAIPRDEALVKELQYFEYELTPSGNVRMNARTGHHDDLVIALALACWQSRGAGMAGRMYARNGRVAAGGW